MMIDPTSELFNAFAQVSRANALPALKARAERERLIITTCSYCNAYLGEQDGQGVAGVSSGICEKCREEMAAPLAICEACMAGYHEEITTEPCPCCCHPSVRNPHVAEPFRSLLNGLMP